MMRYERKALLLCWCQQNGSGQATLIQQLIECADEWQCVHGLICGMRRMLGVSDQITLHLFQPHQADQMLTLLTQEGSSFLSTC